MLLYVNNLTMLTYGALRMNIRSLDLETKWPSGAPLHILSKLYDVPVGFYPHPSIEVVYCFICGHQRVAVAGYRMICLVFYYKSHRSFYTYEQWKHNNQIYFNILSMLRGYSIYFHGGIFAISWIQKTDRTDLKLNILTFILMPKFHPKDSNSSMCIG